MPANEGSLSFVERLPVGVCRIDRDLRHIYVNRWLADFIGFEYPEGGVLALGDVERKHPVIAAARAIFEAGQRIETEFPLKTPRGRRVVLMRLEPEKDAAGNITHVAGVGLDITTSRNLEDALRESEARFKAFMDHTPTVAWIKDEEGRYLFANQYYEQQFGLPSARWRGKTDFDLWPEDFARVCRDSELEVLKDGKPMESVGPAPDHEGRIRQWHLIRFPFKDASGRRYIGGIATDVTERRQVEEKVRLESVMDDLTGLYNRRGFLERAEQEYARAREVNSPCAMFYIDLDGLKAINDSYGHDAGDNALIAVSEILRVTFRNSDVLGRLGGDEFAVLAVNCRKGDLLYERLLINIQDYNRTHAPPQELSLSIGHLIIDPRENQALDDVLLHADEKMYADKRSRQG